MKCRILIPLLLLAALLAAVSPRWRAMLPAEFSGSPALHEGRMVIASRSGLLVSLDAKGRVAWKRDLAEPLFSSPVIDRAGTIYVATGKGSVVALDGRGEEKAQVTLPEPIRASPLLMPGALWVIGEKGTLFRLGRNDLGLQGKREMHLPVYSSAIQDAKRGLVLVPVEDFILLCLDREGQEKWRFRTVGALHSSPAVNADGEVLLTSMDHALYKISAEGHLVWKFSSERWINSSPVVDGEGSVYFGCYDKFFYKVSAQGRLLWRFQGQAEFTSTAAIDEEGRIYAGDSSGTVYGLSPQGKKLWSFKTDDFVRSAFAILANPRLLVAGSIAGEVMAFPVPRRLSRTAPWPKLLGDERNASRAD